MNDQLHLTDDQLRLATSRTLPPGAALDPATVGARASFLAIGASLESAASDLDEAALISRLSREQTCSRSPSTTSLVVRGSPDPAPGQSWPLLLCGALAASALFAIVRIATVLPTSDQQIAVANDSRRPAVVERKIPTVGQPTLAWNDPLDDEIALAAATIEQYRSRGQSFDNSLFDMNVQLEALSQELLRESL